MGRDGLTAAILVGGKSRRMGQDKALMAIAPDGVTVVESVVRKVGMVVDETVLVGNETSDYAFLGLPRIADLVPDAGPLGGIHAALAETRSPHVLVIACDMPFLSVDLLRYMASRPRDYDVLVPILDRPQPLHAIYARNCLPIIEQRLRAGRFQVTGWFEQAIVRSIGREEMRRYDPALRSCYNMNIPEDYELARRILAMPPAAGGEILRLRLRTAALPEHAPTAQTPRVADSGRTARKPGGG